MEWIKNIIYNPSVLATTITLLSVTFSFIATTIGSIIKWVKARKAGKKAEADLIVKEAVADAVEFAENVKTTTSQNLDASTKKLLATTKVQQELMQKGIEYNEEQVSEEIESRIRFSKSVNARQRDKDKANASK